MKILLFIISFLASFFIGVDISDSNFIQNRVYKVYTSKIKKNTKLLFFSDMHSREFGRNNEILIKKIEDINPDIILIGGDLITSKFVFETESMYRLLSVLTAKYPVYMGIGNHEGRLAWDKGRYCIQYDELIRRIKECGVTVLDNEAALLDEYGINLSGLSLGPAYYRKQHKFTLSKSVLDTLVKFEDNGNFNIMLAHNPEFSPEYSRTKADMVLSGHLHGGVMRLPKRYGFINPRFHLIIPNCWGAFKQNGTINIITQGLAMHSVPLRLFNSAELTVIDMYKKIK